MKTVGSAIDEVAGRFANAGLCFGHGTDNADDEAAWLVLRAAGIGFDVDSSVYQRPLDAATLDKISRLSRRRIRERIPLAYLLNEAWFAGRPYYVDERVLVPRSPLAELIDTRFQPFIDYQRITRIADVGTGSGCIAIAAALALPDARVDAIDVSPDALEVAAINRSRYALEHRVELIESDFFNALAARRYDVILSNPPYVDAEDFGNAAAEFRHEPELGLIAGVDGLDAVRVLLKESSRFLTDDGILICEVGNSKAAVEEAWPNLPFIWLEFEHGGDGVFLLDKNALDTLCQETVSEKTS